MKAILKFLQEARTELAKVSWPTRSTVINLTLAVLFVSLLLTAYTAGVDYLMTQGVKWLTAISQQVKKTTTKEIPQVDLGQIQTDLEKSIKTDNSNK